MSIELKEPIAPMTAAEAKAEMQRYQEYCAAMLVESDYTTIQGAKRKNKSAWRKLGRANRFSYDILKEEEINREDEEGKKYWVYRYTVRAISPDGRIAAGVGACSSRERKFAHPDHDIPATAYTRATNRAISDLIGVGEVSAEEIEGDAIDKAFKGRLDGKTI